MSKTQATQIFIVEMKDVEGNIIGFQPRLGKEVNNSRLLSPSEFFKTKEEAAIFAKGWIRGYKYAVNIYINHKRRKAFRKGKR